jgi:hypothetical protein
MVLFTAFILLCPLSCSSVVRPQFITLSLPEKKCFSVPPVHANGFLEVNANGFLEVRFL